jgi:hypothetical protein
MSHLLPSNLSAVQGPGATTSLRWILLHERRAAGHSLWSNAQCGVRAFYQFKTLAGSSEPCWQQAVIWAAGTQFSSKL